MSLRINIIKKINGGIRQQGPKANLATSTHSNDQLWRKILAISLGFLAFWLIIASIIGFWLNRTLTDTNSFTATVSPILRDEPVRRYITTKLTDEIIKNTNANDLSKQFLTPGQIRSLPPSLSREVIRSNIQDSATKTLSSPSFINLWEQTIRNFHRQALALVESESSTGVINLKPEIDSLTAILQKSAFGHIIKADALSKNSLNTGIDSKQMEGIRSAYDHLHDRLQLLWLVSFLVIALTLLSANRRWKALRNLNLASALGMGLIVTAITLLPKLGTPSGKLEHDALQSVAVRLFSDLKSLAIWVALINLLVVLLILVLPRAVRNLRIFNRASST